MTDPLIPTGDNTASTLNSGGSIIPRAVMNTTQMRELAEAMSDPPDPGSVTRRWGIIAAFNSAPDYTVDVTIGGVLVSGLAYDAAYTPTVNEVVMLDVVGTDTVVIGTTAPGGWRTGEIEPTFLPAPKNGALFCQGQALSRTTYANLWSWITAHNLGGGKPFGNGDGSTTFTLPDLRGRMPIGAGTLGGDTYAVGDLPGAARVTLATNQMPAHSHAPSGTAASTSTSATTIGGHTHPVSATTSAGSNHSHGFDDGGHSHNGNTAGETGHSHNIATVKYTQGTAHEHYGTGNVVSEAANPSSGSSGSYSMSSGGSSGHSHGFTTGSASANGTTGGESGHTHTFSTTSGSTTATATTTTTTNTTVTITEATVGGSTPVDVRQPAFVVNWLIYV